MEMRKVFSSHVDAVGYDPETKELHVSYSKGQFAIYEDVSPETADEVMGSASIGQALHRLVKGKHEYR